MVVLASAVTYYLMSVTWLGFFFFKGPEVLVAPSHSLGPPQDYSVMIHFCNR